ncbi:10643_t:CDS:2, partial [Scutellospora calospora]
GTPLCYDRPNPFKPQYVVNSPCYMVTENSNSNSKRDNTDMFVVNFTCGVTDQVLCQKVKNAFISAGQILTEAIIFTQTVQVNATFIDICAAYGVCSVSNGQVIGAAAPARSILINDGGTSRFYPQALVKQQNNQNHPEYSIYDIVAVFNSRNISYWFKSDGIDIKSNQIDIEMVILHEFVHGLGFTSSLNEYLLLLDDSGRPYAGSRTPLPGLTPYIINTTLTNYHLVETVLDKFMSVLITNQKISDITKQMDIFGNTQFNTPNDFATTFVNSSQYSLAMNLKNYAIKPKTLGLLTNGNTNVDNAIILETWINPFMHGSSISHFSYVKYTNTSDFLMRFMAENGTTLQQHILKGGNYSWGAIGPQLRLFFDSIGYTIRDPKSLPSQNSNNTNNANGSISGVSISAIIGAAIGGVIGGVLITFSAVMIYFWYKRRRNDT